MSNDLLIPALDGPVTRKHLGVSKHVMQKLKKEGVLVPTGEFEKNMDATGKPIAGRPWPFMKLTDKGRKRAKRAKERLAAA